MFMMDYKERSGQYGYKTARRSEPGQMPRAGGIHGAPHGADPPQDDVTNNGKPFSR